MENMPMITPSSDADWKRYYEKKYQSTDKQLKDVAWAFTHMLRFVMESKKDDAILLARRIHNRLEYPRDKDDLLKEIAKYPEHAGSILREADHEMP